MYQKRPVDAEFACQRDISLDEAAPLHTYALQQVGCVYCVYAKSRVCTYVLQSVNQTFFSKRDLYAYTKWLYTYASINMLLQAYAYTTDICRIYIQNMGFTYVSIYVSICIALQRRVCVCERERSLTTSSFQIFFFFRRLCSTHCTLLYVCERDIFDQLVLEIIYSCKYIFIYSNISFFTGSTQKIALSCVCVRQISL